MCRFDYKPISRSQSFATAVKVPLTHDRIRLPAALRRKSLARRAEVLLDKPEEPHSLPGDDQAAGARTSPQRRNNFSLGIQQLVHCRPSDSESFQHPQAIEPFPQKRDKILPSSADVSLYKSVTDHSSTSKLA
jgi:hypothetical protein